MGNVAGAGKDVERTKASWRGSTPVAEIRKSQPITYDANVEAPMNIIMSFSARNAKSALHLPFRRWCEAVGGNLSLRCVLLPRNCFQQQPRQRKKILLSQLYLDMLSKSCLHQS